MPLEEWNIYDRKSDICINDDLFIDYPYEANIWQMPVDEQVEHLLSISHAGCNCGVPKPELFEDWIVWKLGEKIAKEYMFPYNKKIWSIDLKRLGTYWMEKLPDVSMRETLYSCLEHKAYGNLPGHAKFYYPKQFGFGELFLRMADRLKDHIVYKEEVKNLQVEPLCVNNRFFANKIINTVPWKAFEHSADMPEEILQAIGELEYTSIVIEYQPDEADTQAHWTYYPDEELSYHRILWRSNFCEGSTGYWTETNLKRFSHDPAKFSYVNQFAYPLNTIEKPDAIARILDWARTKNILGLGRWGEWEHLNTDVTVERAMHLADGL